MTDLTDGHREVRTITSWINTITPQVTVNEAFTFMPVSGDLAKVLPGYTDPAILRSNPSGNTLNVSASGKADSSATTNIPPGLR